MFETVLLAAAVAATPAPEKKREVPPPAELLEFIGEWSDEEARRFLDPKPAAGKVSKGKTDEDSHRKEEPGDDR